MRCSGPEHAKRGEARYTSRALYYRVAEAKTDRLVYCYETPASQVGLGCTMPFPCLHVEKWDWVQHLQLRSLHIRVTWHMTQDLLWFKCYSYEDIWLSRVITCQQCAFCRTDVENLTPVICVRKITNRRSDNMRHRQRERLSGWSCHFAETIGGLQVFDAEGKMQCSRVDPKPKYKKKGDAGMAKHIVIFPARIQN